MKEGVIKEEELKKVQKNLKKMRKSNEQFMFIIFKNEDGTDNVTAYSFNMPYDKLKHYFTREMSNAKLEDHIDEKP